MTLASLSRYAGLVLPLVAASSYTAAAEEAVPPPAPSAQLASNYCFSEGPLRAPHADVAADGTNHVSWYRMDPERKIPTLIGYDLSPQEVRSMWESAIAQEVSDEEMRAVLDICTPENKLLQSALHKLRLRGSARRAAAVMRSEQASRPEDKALRSFADIMEDESKRHPLSPAEQGALDALNAVPAAASALKKLAIAAPARMEKMIFKLGDERGRPITRPLPPLPQIPEPFGPRRSQ